VKAIFDPRFSCCVPAGGVVCLWILTILNICYAKYCGTIASASWDSAKSVSHRRMMRHVTMRSKSSQSRVSQSFPKKRSTVYLVVLVVVGVGVGRMYR
jgi:hypothetical protein